MITFGNTNRIAKVLREYQVMHTKAEAKNFAVAHLFRVISLVIFVRELFEVLCTPRGHKPEDINTNQLIDLLVQKDKELQNALKTGKLLFVACHSCFYRVATAQGKQGIWKSIFPDRENTGNLLKILKICFYTGNLQPTQGKFWELKKIINL